MRGTIQQVYLNALLHYDMQTYEGVGRIFHRLMNDEEFRTDMERLINKYLRLEL